MHISHLITLSRVMADFPDATKRGVLATLSEVLARDLQPPMAPWELRDIFLEREKLGSTGVGNGIAIPHGRIVGLSSPLVALGRIRQGILFDAVDGQPVYVVAALLSPAESNTLHLTSLATVVRFLRHRHVRHHLQTAPDRAAMAEVLTAKETFFPHPTDTNGEQP